MLNKIVFSLSFGFAAATTYPVNLTWNSNEIVNLDQLAVGDIVDITGVENPSTGYTWIMTPNSNTALYTIIQNEYVNTQN